MRLLGRGVEVKRPEQVDVMRRAGLVVADALARSRAAVRPGITTGELDALAEGVIRAHGALPSFLGYEGFPAALCISVNDEVVHGIPGDRVLREGDLVSLDCGAIVDGWHGDSAITVPVGQVSVDAAELVAVTEEAMWQGIAAARLGGRVGDISAAVQSHVGASGGFGIVEEYVGHGIGSQLHQPPDVPSVGRRGRGHRLVPGLVLAVEPMLTAGSPDNLVLEDGWTVVTLDGGWAAHWEHTVTLTERGAWVLTAEDGGEAALARLGVPYGGR